MSMQMPEGKKRLEAELSMATIGRGEVQATMLGLSLSAYLERLLVKALDFHDRTGLLMEEIPPRIVEQFRAEIASEVDEINGQ